MAHLYSATPQIHSFISICIIPFVMCLYDYSLIVISELSRRFTVKCFDRFVVPLQFVGKMVFIAIPRAEWEN